MHVVIVGFGYTNPAAKRIYDYELDAQNPTMLLAANISPYLIEGADTAVTNRSKPLCAVPEIGIGNKPIDDGNYLFSTKEMETFVEIEPASKPFFTSGTARMNLLTVGIVGVYGWGIVLQNNCEECLNV